jgi:(S)-citramalyl-CoA lyase
MIFDRPQTFLAGVRSALFTPATRIGHFDKGRTAGADIVIIDLEDGVGAVDKPGARRAVGEFAASLTPGTPWILRINHVTTEAGLQDLLALRSSKPKPPALMLPKVESPVEVDILCAHLSSDHKPTCVVPLIETALGLERAAEIARHPAVAALALGGADLAADLSAEMTWEPMLFARGRIVQAAAVGGVPSWDVPFLAMDDAEGLGRETRAVRAMGFAAKLAIHPRQLPTINAAFSPSTTELDRARQIVEVFEKAKGGACSLDSQMIDMPVVIAARRTLLRAGHVT